MKHILLPLDGSDPSWKAVDYAADTYADVRLTLLHVVDPVEGVYTGIEGGYFDAEAIDRATARGQEFLDDARDRLEETPGSETLDVNTVVETGRPEHVIIEYTEEHDVDHIVMGSHGRVGFQRILLGSVAETVVRRSPVPVTIIRDDNPHPPEDETT